MKINLKTQPMAPTEAMRAAVNRYAMKLNSPRVTSVDVIMRTDNRIQLAEVILHGRKLEVFAKAKSNDMYQSLKEAVNKVRTQLLRKTNH